MEKGRVVAFSLLMLFAISIVSAADTEIKIRTLPDHDVDVYALRVGETYNLIESFHKKSDSNGSVSVVLSTTEEKFNLKVGVRKDNTMIVPIKKFNETYTSGTPVEVEIYPQWYLEQLAIEQSGNFADDNNSSVGTPEIANESEVTINDTSSLNKTEEKSFDSSAITGFFASLKDKVQGKALTYSVVFILLVGVLGFYFMKKRRRHGHDFEEETRPEIKTVKLSELQERNEKNDGKKSLIDDVEKKILDLQEQVKKMRES